MPDHRGSEVIVYCVHARCFAALKERVQSGRVCILKLVYMRRLVAPKNSIALAGQTMISIKWDRATTNGKPSCGMKAPATCTSVLIIISVAPIESHFVSICCWVMRSRNWVFLKKNAAATVAGKNESSRVMLLWMAKAIGSSCDVW